MHEFSRRSEGEESLFEVGMLYGGLGEGDML
jgi:hypothetical protein